jgi:hypothetical protein
MRRLSGRYDAGDNVTSFDLGSTTMFLRQRICPLKALREGQTDVNAD